MESTPSSTHILSRIRYLMERNRLTQASLARRLGIDPSNVSKYLTGRLPISDSLINRIIVNFNVSKDWLREGRGLPYDKLSGSEPAVESGVITDDWDGYGIPVYDIDVAAGVTEMAMAFTRENVIGKLNFPNLNSDWVAVRAKGDSMMPIINNGGYVAFLPVSDKENILWGQIYVVVMENRRVVKYVRRHPDPDKIILKSANPAYDDIDIPLRDVYGLYVVERIINIQDCF